MKITNPASNQTLVETKGMLGMSKEEFIAEAHRLGIEPTFWGLEYAYDYYDSMPEMAQSIQFFRNVVRDLKD